MPLYQGSDLRRDWRFLSVMAALILAGAGWLLASYFGQPRLTEHDHEKGAHEGIIVSVGHDHHHVEAVFTSDGELKFFTLGQDQTKVVTVPLQELTAYVRVASVMESIPVSLQPSRQPGDPADQTSAFVGRLPEQLIGQQLIVTVPSLRIADQRYRFSFMTAATSHEAVMPSKIGSQEERDLYLNAGGCYTRQDVLANGSVTASEKYRAFKSAHDFNPRAGDRICPVTRTKANPACTWIVRGREYQFCCPPCIDEFVKRAKATPDEILAPEKYVYEARK